MVVTDYLEPDFEWEQEQLRQRGLDFEWTAHQAKFAKEDELVKIIGDAEVVIVNMARMTPAVINRLGRCKLIIRHGIGYDNVDVAAATARGIRVTNTPGVLDDTTADLTWALLMAAARRI
ncbi:MAG: hypothetical protein JXL80_16140, partial [Planctomycetes bacterium]|nr:hypothetical protein [Planctomycetota bacterium]